MATEEGEPQEPEEGEMLPDEAAVLPKRGRELDETEEEDLLTVDEVAADLGIDLD